MSPFFSPCSWEICHLSLQPKLWILKTKKLALKMLPLAMHEVSLSVLPTNIKTLEIFPLEFVWSGPTTKFEFDFSFHIHMNFWNIQLKLGMLYAVSMNKIIKVCCSLQTDRPICFLLQTLRKTESAIYFQRSPQIGNCTFGFNSGLLWKKSFWERRTWLQQLYVWMNSRSNMPICQPRGVQNPPFLIQMMLTHYTLRSVLFRPHHTPHID